MYFYIDNYKYFCDTLDPMKQTAMPQPGELGPARDDVKITIALSRRSVSFFKDEARRRRTKYQRMIRDLVDRYASQFAP